MNVDNNMSVKTTVLQRDNLSVKVWDNPTSDLDCLGQPYLELRLNVSFVLQETEGRERTEEGQT